MMDLKTYAAFHAESVASNEIDDVYPVLKEFHRLRNTETESAVWLTFVYVAYYNMGTALRVYEQHPNPELPLLELRRKVSIGTERRAHRVPERLDHHLMHLLSLADSNGGLWRWVSGYVTDNRVESWNNVVAALETIYGNGRWAAYKTAEMLWKIHGLPLQAPDMGHAHSSGPRKGLALLYDGLPAGHAKSDVATLDAVSNDLLNKLTDLGVQASIEEAETSLCDVHALAAGDYYLGMDIDAMQENLLKQPCGLTHQMFEARRNVIPNHYLGEINGWDGVDKNRKRVYKETGRLLFRTPK